MGSKFVDTTAIVQVIGCVWNDPTILEREDAYTIIEDDFPEQFHRTVFGALYKIYETGIKAFTLDVVNDYLEQHPKYKAMYDLNKGDEYIDKANGGIGIVPYVYEDARNYYTAIFAAQERSQAKPIEQWQPKVIEVHIPPPVSKPIKSSRFAFLDEEE